MKKKDVIKGAKILNREILRISKYIKAKQKTFDKVAGYSREIIRCAAQSITYMHNNKLREAQKQIEKARTLLNLKEFKDTRFDYYSQQAQQEFAEASIFLSIKSNKVLPSCKDVKVRKEAYLLGLMDCVGELKREVLEELRNKNLNKAEYYFDTMQLIYDLTRPMRFGEAVLQGFRRKQDVARIQIENAGTELLSFSHTSKK